jgi:hypothetical protein
MDIERFKDFILYEEYSVNEGGNIDMILSFIEWIKKIDIVTNIELYPNNIFLQINKFKDNPYNKISNLREATYQENSENYKTPKTNKSGVKNVSWYKSLNKWVVSISIRKTKKTVGYYDDLELAELVAIEARNKYRGEFANHG